MKLSNRLHNISLNLHTISGVILCVVLFVIFYCGAFSFFKDNISSWEKRIDSQKEIPAGISLIDSAYNQLTDQQLYQNREIGFFGFEKQSNFNILVAGDSLHKRKTFAYIHELAPRDKKKGLNDFIYHLHYLRPIPAVGLYIAGVICVFFVFSIFTGILIHLKNFFRDLFLLRKKKKKLTFLKDSHIVFGIITLPFQLMYAVTGSVFCILLILILPQVLVQFDGDTSEMEKYFKDVQPTLESANNPYEFNQMSSIITNFEIENQVSLNYLRIYHFNDENMQLLLVGRNDNIDSEVKSLYTAKSNERVVHIPNREANLSEHVNNWLADLHYANFGGVFLKFSFFVLAMISCIVFYSGGLLWIETRKKEIKRLNFYFEGIIWGLIVAMALSFLLRYLIVSVPIIFYTTWLVWALLALCFSRTKYVQISKIIVVVLTTLFVVSYFFLEQINSMQKLVIPLMCIMAVSTLILYRQKPLLKDNKLTVK